MTELIDVQHDFVDSAKGLVVARSQLVTAEHMDMVSDMRTASANNRAGEYHCVASIPVAVVEKWLTEGFDVFKEPARKIVARLRKEDLSAFIATSKRI